MTSEEKYYRRTYSLLNDLINTYSNGFDKKETLKFWKKSLIEIETNPSLLEEKRDSLLLTIIISLLGVNKESIEKAGIIDEYKKSLIITDLRNVLKKPLSIEKISEFNSLRTTSTPFDEWLSIIKCPGSDANNNDIIRRVRNGLLHSNFTIDTEAASISFTKIKTKSYYESIIFNQNFFQFIFTYFSNIPTIGLCEKTIVTYSKSDEKIVNKKRLREYLESIVMVHISHSMDNFEGDNSLDNRISEALKAKNRKTSVLKELNNAESNGIEIKDIYNHTLTGETIDSIIIYFEGKYGNNFYSLPQKEKLGLINSYIQYIFENKRHISNWLSHFYYVINNSINPNFDINSEFFLNDQYHKESLQPALAILKGYLILYRLQNNTFSSIDYNKIDFDFNGNDFHLWSEKDNNTTTENYFLESFNKKRMNSNLSDEEIKKVILCEVIRDGFAHGNISCFVCENNTIIEIKDINKKNNQSRCIQMTIDKFNSFLSSEAFLPKYCFDKSIDNNGPKLS